MMYTPAPWEYKKEFGREGLILTPEGEAIAAFMPDGVGNEARMQGNIALICASPMMLEALEKIARIEIEDDPYPLYATAAAHAEAVFIARTTIAAVRSSFR